jgi:hypothetical protein
MHRILGGAMLAGDAVSLLLIGAAASGGISAGATNAPVGLPPGSNPALPPANAAGTPLLTGGTSIDTAATNIALTEMDAASANYAAFSTLKTSLLESMSSAQALGATTVTEDAAAGMFHFFNASGIEIANTSMTNGFLLNIL